MSIAAGAAPLQCTWVSLTSSPVAISSPNRCTLLPWPLVALLILPGLAWA